MHDHDTEPGRPIRRDAIDINDFVYAATGSRVRRLTLPDGTHWFPAADVCRKLGYPTMRKALLDHVPETHRDVLETVTRRHSLSIPAGRKWRRDLQMISLQGLVLLVHGCPRPSCRPFKEWMTQVIVAVQRDGSYSLERSEVQPTAPDAPPAYAMPPEVTEAIVRLAERSLRGDERFVAALDEANRTRREATEALRSVAAMQQRSVMAMHEAMVESVRSQRELAHTMSRVADALDDILRTMTSRHAPRISPPQTTAAGIPEQRGPGTPGPDRSAEHLLAAWRARLTLTDDVWAVAQVLAPPLAAHGEVRLPVATIASRASLTEARTHDSLRLLVRRQCIRRIGTIHDAPVYEVHRA